MCNDASIPQPMKMTCFRFVTLLCIALGLAVSHAAKGADDWVSLFDGKTLTGWKADGFEAQVNNTQPVFEKNHIENKKAGSLYGIRNLNESMVRDTDWSYILEIQQKTGLTWRNMWVPGHEPTRAQRALVRN